VRFVYIATADVVRRVFKFKATGLDSSIAKSPLRRNKMKRIMLVAAATAALSGAFIAPAMAHVNVDVVIAPPAPRVVVAPPPRHGYVWAPGYWRWEGHQHVWVDGRWLHERHQQHWVSDRWDDRHDHYHYEPGHWERD
jgi:WXXGXW repeat (2 copies)